MGKECKLVSDGVMEEVARLFRERFGEGVLRVRCTYSHALEGAPYNVNDHGWVDWFWPPDAEDCDAGGPVLQLSMGDGFGTFCDLDKAYDDRYFEVQFSDPEFFEIVMRVLGRKVEVMRLRDEGCKLIHRADKLAESWFGEGEG